MESQEVGAFVNNPTYFSGNNYPYLKAHMKFILKNVRMNLECC